MIKLQKEVYKNTSRLGYSCEKKDIYKHLRGEIKEYKDSKPLIDNNLIPVILDIEEDDKFVKMYEKYIKDSEPCELIDFIMVALSRLTRLGINAAMMFKIKLRYNKLRKVKK